MFGCGDQPGESVPLRLGEAPGQAGWGGERKVGPVLGTL